MGKPLGNRAKIRSSKCENPSSLWSLNYRGTRVKDDYIISPDWEGVIEGGFQQSSSWVSLSEIARKLEVRNLKIEIHTGASAAFIMEAIVVKENCIISPDWEGVI